MKEEVRPGVIYDDLNKLYEVRHKMHIAAPDAERATELGILFVNPTRENMKEHNIKCWIRDTFVQECRPIVPAKGEHDDQVAHMRRQHASFYGQECPNAKEEPDVRDKQEDDDDVPF